MVSTGRPGHGLVGYGISMYKPLCAFACRDVLSTSVLSCSSHTHESEGMEMDMHKGGETSPECYATDDAFLQTLAFCMATRCRDVAVWDLERYWDRNVPGRQPNQPIPKVTYQQTLANMTSAPSDNVVVGEVLTEPMIVSDEDWEGSYNAQGVFEEMESRHETYGCVLPWSLRVVD